MGMYARVVKAGVLGAFVMWTIAFDLDKGQAGDGKSFRDTKQIDATQRSKFPDEFRSIFLECAQGRKDSLQTIREANRWATTWFLGDNMSVQKVKRHIYELSWQGQVLTLLLINQLPKDTPFLGLGKTCHALLHGWRLSLEEGVNSARSRRLFGQWVHCAEYEVYSDQREIELIDLFKKCTGY